MTTSRWPHILILALLLSADLAVSEQLTVYLKPPKEQVTLVAIESANQREHNFALAQKQENRFMYVLDLNQLGEILPKDQSFYEVEVIPRIEGRSHDGLSLRIPPTLRREGLSIYVMMIEPKLHPDTVRHFRSRGLSGDQAYLTYFEARYLYKELVDRNLDDHPLTVPIAYWFFSASYELATRGLGYIQIDPKSLEASSDMLSRRHTDPIIKDGFKEYSIDPSHWQKMVDKAKRLDFQVVSLVEDVAKSRNIE